ncbi:MAG: FAD binding domain-containing protein [Actinomycetota bacterium]
MFPARFDYHAPTDLEEAVALLSQDEEAKVLAGGQSLIPMMKLRFATPGILIDLNGIPHMDVITATRGGNLLIGAMARHNQLAASTLLRTSCPIMTTAAPLIADPIVRNRGTIGGSLAHADPAGDWGSVLLALGAEVVARSARGERVLPVSDLLVDVFTTSLQADEIITEIRIPKPRGPSGGTYLKLERKVGDFATVGAAVQMEMNNGSIARAGIALTAVGARNVQAREAEDALAGAEPTPEAFEEAARLAADAADPVSDLRGPAEYKRSIVETFVKRGLSTAHRMASAV